MIIFLVIIAVLSILLGIRLTYSFLYILPKNYSGEQLRKERADVLHVMLIAYWFGLTFLVIAYVIKLIGLH